MKNEFIVLSLFISIVLFANIVSANYGSACINCPQNGIIEHTGSCDIKGNHFSAGIYNWTITNNGTIIATGLKRVDNTEKFCIKDVISECGDYQINFGYATINYSIECLPPVVPEFSFTFGMITLLSALGIFFIARREDDN